MEHNFILKVGVKVILVSDLGRFLFLKRNESVYGNKGFLLDIPGGRIDPDQDLISNLKREVMEETQIESFGEPVLLGAQDIWHDNQHTVRLTYISRVTGEEVVLSEEHERFEWISLKDLQERTEEVDGLVMSIIKDKMSFIENFTEKSGKTQ